MGRTKADLLILIERLRISLGWAMAWTQLPDRADFDSEEEWEKTDAAMKGASDEAKAVYDEAAKLTR